VSAFADLAQGELEPAMDLKTLDPRLIISVMTKPCGS
jgi:hypothetical protein